MAPTSATKKTATKELDMKKLALKKLALKKAALKKEVATIIAKEVAIMQAATKKAALKQAALRQVAIEKEVAIMKVATKKAALKQAASNKASMKKEIAMKTAAIKKSASISNVTPQAARANITAAFAASKVTKSGRRFAVASAKASAVVGFGDNAIRHNNNDDDDDGDRLGECYSDNDMRDVDYQSTDRDSDSASEDWSSSESEDGFENEKNVLSTASTATWRRRAVSTRCSTKTAQKRPSRSMSWTAAVIWTMKSPCTAVLSLASPSSQATDKKIGCGYTNEMQVTSTKTELAD
jgi:hypothetical protein